jgi:hypothetical protein
VVPSLLTLVVSLTRWMVSHLSDTANRPKMCQKDMFISFKGTALQRKNLANLRID